jgi:hypothetical protein
MPLSDVLARAVAYLRAVYPQGEPVTYSDGFLG